MSAAKQQEQETVTYFAFGPGSHVDKPFEPWSLTVQMGGERTRDGSGKVFALPGKMIRFSKQGVYHTAAPDEIEVLDKYAAQPGSGITRDSELFLSKTLPTDRLNQRLQAQIKGLEEEKNRLRLQLETKIAK